VTRNDRIVKRTEAVIALLLILAHSPMRRSAARREDGSDRAALAVTRTILAGTGLARVRRVVVPTSGCR